MNVMLRLGQYAAVAIKPTISERDCFTRGATRANEIAYLRLSFAGPNRAFQIFAPEHSGTAVRENLGVVGRLLLRPELVRRAAVLLQAANDKLPGAATHGNRRRPRKS